ncbi:MAG: hypothetical protein LBD54_00080 [Puniceicoccales bacterium]|jgi:hypothetical protein|nr:hypothetical protein [Puniceicoccales bacterium]
MDFKPLLLAVKGGKVDVVRTILEVGKWDTLAIVDACVKEEPAVGVEASDALKCLQEFVRRRGFNPETGERLPADIALMSAVKMRDLATINARLAVPAVNVNARNDEGEYGIACGRPLGLLWR